MKEMQESRARWRGLFNITVAPISADGEIDFAGRAANSERVITLGFDGGQVCLPLRDLPPAVVEEARAGLARLAVDARSGVSLPATV